MNQIADRPYSSISDLTHDKGPISLSQSLTLHALESVHASLLSALMGAERAAYNCDELDCDDLINVIKDSMSDVRGKIMQLGFDPPEVTP